MTTYLDLHLETCAMQTHAAGTTAHFSAPRPGRPDPNEDALAILTGHDSLVLALADGAGGTSGGDLAAAAALAALSEELVKRGGRSLRETILSGFEEANRRVLALGLGAATTLVVAEIAADAVRSYHVGDSMLLHVGQRGRRKLETIAHSPVGYAVEAGMLDEDEAMHHAERHLVSNMVGMPGMRVEMSAKKALRPRDTLLLASDGLTDNLLVDELIEVIRKGPLDRAGDSLASRAAARMRAPREGQPSKPDDLTFVLFRPRK